MKLQPELNAYLQAQVSAFASISSTFSSDSPMLRTELDSHANMIVVGKNASVFSRVNLVPPFILREAGVLMNDVPKIHVKDPTENDHAIVFPDDNLQIPLQLHSIFSFFHTRMPTTQEIDQCTKIIITPDSTDWDPHNESYALNEESMLDWNGDIMETRYRKRYIIECPFRVLMLLV